MALTSGKKALFWGITILLPFLLLTLVEFGLRIGGYNEEVQELFIEAPNDPNFLIANISFVGRYFPSFTPKVASNPFRKEKSPNTFRIFVFGGSSTQGFPYNFYYSFSDKLEQKLLLNTNGLNIEVINLGMTAVNSYVIKDLSKRVLPYKPDAIVIYGGHNEFYGSFGAGSTQFGLINNIAFKQLVIRLKNLRIYQLIEQILKSEPDQSRDRRTLMAKVVRESDIELESEVFEKGVEQFEKNIQDVIYLYEKEDVPVFIGTVASNLKDQPPLGDNENALNSYNKARELFDKGEIDSALAEFIKAKEHDGIRFRAPLQINEIINDLAENENTYLVDIQKMMRNNSESGIEDNSLFIDHLHPNWIGHELIADSFLDELINVERIEQAFNQTSFDTPKTISRFEEIYANTAISRLLVGYPFQKGLTQNQELAQFQQIYDNYLSSSYIDSLAAATSRNQEEVPKALTDIINYARVNKDTSTVLTHYYDLLKWQLNSVTLIEKGIEYSVNNRKADVYIVGMILQALNDGLYDPRYMDVLSAVYIINGELDKAKYWLDESERLGSNAPMLYYNLARYHILKGDTLKAGEYYNRFMQSQRSN